MKPMTAGLALILAASAVQAAPKSTITKVSATNVSGGVEIAVVGENLSAPKTFFAKNNTLFIVEFGAALVPSSGSIAIDSNGVGNVRYVRYAPNPSPKARLTIEVTKGIVPTVTWDPLESTCRHASLSIL